jgi:hypothetical protein
MTLDEARRLASQFPPLIPIETAGALVGMSRTGSYEAAARGELPLLAFGRRRMVVTARWLAMLGLETDPALETEGAPIDLEPEHDGGARLGAPIDQLAPSTAKAEDRHAGS